MAKITGAQCKVYIEQAGTGKVLAGQRNATLNRSAESIDATTKTSDGWKEALAGFKEFSIDCDGAFVVDDAAYSLLEDAFTNGESVFAYIEMPTGTKYRGETIITDAGLEFPYDDLVTYSISLQGTGALEKVTA